MKFKGTSCCQPSALSPQPSALSPQSSALTHLIRRHSHWLSGILFFACLLFNSIAAANEQQCFDTAGGALIVKSATDASSHYGRTDGYYTDPYTLNWSGACAGTWRKAVPSIGPFSVTNENGQSTVMFYEHIYSYGHVGTGSSLTCVDPIVKNYGWVGNESGSSVTGTGSFCVTRLDPPTLIGFFNGVANTQKEGRASLDILKTELPSTPEKPVEYELFYNQSGCKEGATGKLSCLQDVAEVFEQRSTELSGVLGNRWEVFWEILAGKHQQPGSLTSTLLSRLVDTASALFGLIDSIFSNVITRFASAFTNLLSLINSPPTVADKEAHLAKLKTYADKGSGMVLVAHSQGNLFVNVAYDSIKASYPSVKAEVVHVAPASPTLRGDYGLADIDLVINALRITGVTSVPPNNILGMSPSKDDMTGHSFAATYMDKVRAAYTDIKGKLTAAFELVSQ